MVSFDLYAKAVADGLSRHAPGDMVDLDGIDGFFDQYFAGRKEGEMIRFVGTGPPNIWPASLPALLELPFFSAEIVENKYGWARVRLCEISTLGDWSLGRQEQPSPSSQLPFSVPLPIELAAFLQQAQSAGWAYWYSKAQYWRSLSEVTAVGALAGVDSLGLWVLTTNAVPSHFARVTL